MTTNILITGAGGYIGGSIAADFVNGKAGVVGNVTIYASVRSAEQAESWSGRGVKVLVMDLGDAQNVEKHVVENEIDIIINNATSIDPNAITNLVNALGTRRKTSGRQAVFIHTSGLSAFSKQTGWPHDSVKDTDALYDIEKKTVDSYIVRQVDTLAIDKAEDNDVSIFTVMPPTIHGRGSGPWNQLSPQIPGHVKAGVHRKQVFKFPEDYELPVIHISDLTPFYAALVNVILQGKAHDIPINRSGYYFPLPSFRITWWTILEHLSQAMHKRGLVNEPTTSIWPSDEEAGEALGVPPRYAQSIFNAGIKVTSENCSKVAWKPSWTKQDFLNSLDDEINDALELAPKSSLLESVKSEK